MYIIIDSGLGVSIEHERTPTLGTGNSVKFFNKLFSSLKESECRLTNYQLESIQRAIQNIQRRCERKSPILYYLQSHLNPYSNAYIIKNLVPKILNIAKNKATFPAVTLPDDVIPLIFGRLNEEELERVSSVCKTWQFFAADEFEKRLESMSTTHASRQWEKFSCQLSDIPKLPKEIFQILDSPCPFWPGKKIEETHFLTFVPGTINNQPYHPNALEKMIDSPVQGFQSTFDVDVQEKYGRSSEHPHWILITKEAIPRSENKDYNEQLSLVKVKAHYDAPSYLEAVTSIFINYAGSDNAESSLTTRCKESIRDNTFSNFTNWEIRWNVSIRKFNRGMFISYHIADPGILAVRRV